MCELIQEDLRQIGVTVIVNSLDMGSYPAAIFDETRWDMVVNIMGSSAYITAGNFSMWVAHMSGAGYVTDFDNPWPGKARFEELFDGLMALSDPTELSNRCMEMYDIVTNQAMLCYGLAGPTEALAFNTELNLVRFYNGTVNYSSCTWNS